MTDTNATALMIRISPRPLAFGVSVEPSTGCSACSWATAPASTNRYKAQHRFRTHRDPFRDRDPSKRSLRLARRRLAKHTYFEFQIASNPSAPGSAGSFPSSFTFAVVAHYVLLNP